MINPNDIRIDTYRAGQKSNWINQNDNAVQITYLPTGEKFFSENPKLSIHKNRSLAHEMLLDYVKTLKFYEATKVIQ